MSWDQMRADAGQASDLLAELAFHGVNAALMGGRLALEPPLDSVLGEDEEWPIAADLARATHHLVAILEAEAILRGAQEPGTA